jgi:arylsulfatase A-like enzyme
VHPDVTTTRKYWLRLPAALASHGVIAGLSLGALAGQVDVVHSGLRRLRGGLVFAPEWFWWTAPWVNAVLVAMVTTALVLLLPRALGRYRDAVRFGVPVALAVAGASLIVPGLHRAAMVVLAVGAGVRGGILLARHAQQADRVLAWSLIPLLVLGPMAASRSFGLSAGAPENPAAVRTGLPNIIIIVLDTVRAIELSLYGGRSGTTPVLDRLGSSGIVFDHASSPAPWTLPSHASLFTGFWPHQLDASLETPLKSDAATLAEVLDGLGYRTGGFSGNVRYASAETGLARGFEHFEDYRWSVSGLVHMTRLSRLFARNAALLARLPADMPGRVDAAVINRRFLHWLRQPSDDAPFFAFLNYFDAHAPYYPPEPQWRRFVGDVPRRPLEVPHGAAVPEAAALERRAYDGAINYIDEQIGALLDSLEAAGELDNTLIIVVSDHGEEFAEHGIAGHGNSLYRPSVHVPLVISWPGRLPTGCRVAAPVSIRDVPATVAHLVEVQAEFPGRSLAPLWTEPGDTGSQAVFTHTQRGINQPEDLPSSRGPLYGVEVWPHRLIVESDPLAVSLFDVENDPLEQVDLAAEPDHEPVVAALLDSLADVGVDIAAAEHAAGTLDEVAEVPVFDVAPCLADG